ncbi:MAG: hypothetical protein P0Y49_10660 [Candidatus Pedobacter colombiensis]|uniref:Uncharacterized protein n=1 Tax=Candidatus Pedobacter colombiensis TaxID=3121371 RepID=A0AAJ5WCM1_9SPHI|nr:hypothetical protein [Pedobacter sp.]WEK21598.1 MAG: hypothetical protein P0Y49_10660 [Pedobacter sp.]
METNEQNQQDADNLLIIKSELDNNKPEKPIDEEVNHGYNSADDTGNTNEDLDLNPDDDPNTNLDETDLDTLNNQDLNGEESS